MPSNERSAEWCRGAVAVLGRMVDECSTVFDSDLPHITQGNLEDYLAEYAQLLAAAEAREAGENAAEISADRAWIDGAKFGWNCETKTDLHEAIANRQLQIREAVVKCPRCDSPDPSLHPAMQFEGEVQPCGDLWHTPAHEAIPGDSLSTTVEKLREACSGVRVAPEPDAPTAAQVIEACEKAIKNLAHRADEAGCRCKYYRDVIKYGHEAECESTNSALALCARWKEANCDQA